MEIKWLEDFLALASTLNFSKAADERHVTQSAFSRRIRQLEAWLGATLVDRATYPSRLTEAGQALQHPAGLRVRGHLALHEDRRARRVDAGRDQLGGGDQGAFAEHLRVLLDRDRVQVDDAVDRRVAAVLAGDVLQEAADVVAQVLGARGLDAGEDDHAGRRVPCGTPRPVRDR